MIMPVKDSKDIDLDMSLPVTVFRHDFNNLFNDFVTEVNVLASGHASYNNTWHDDFGVQGITLSAAAIDGMIAILAAVGLITAAASAAVTVPLSIVSILAAFAYQKWRDDKKEKEYIRAENKLARVDLTNEIEKIADMLVEMYRMQLESCTVKDAVRLADALFKGIASELLRNEALCFDELLQPATLQGVLLRAGSALPNVKLNMNTRDTLFYSTREMVTKPALYCRENNKFYENRESDPKKYGVLFFERKHDLDDYLAIVGRQKNADKKWEYHAMTMTEVSLLKNRSLFRLYRDDVMFSADVAIRART